MAEGFEILEPPIEASGDERTEVLHARILERIPKGIVVKNSGKACDWTGIEVRPHRGFAIRGHWQCEAPLRSLRVSLPYLNNVPASHRHMARFRLHPAEENVRQLTRAKPYAVHTFEGGTGASAPSALRQGEAPTLGGGSLFKAFFVEGLEHIQTGWDHILFLIALLALGGTFLQLATVITAFTVSHSLTLALAYLDIVALPSEIVEPLIAASVVFVALENFWLKDSRRRWLIAGAFGLIHGFGFAGFLSDLELPEGDLALGLLGFNLGVETGQLLLALVAFPVIAALQRRAWHRQRVVFPISLAIAGLGTWWLVERTFVG